MTLLLLLTLGMLAMVAMAAVLQWVYPQDEPPEWFKKLLD